MPIAAAALLALASGAHAGTYVTGALPPEFGGGFVPPDPGVLKNVQKATKEGAKLVASVEKCYAKGAANFAKGKATGVDTCLNDSSKGVVPKYVAKVAGIAGKAPGLPPCHDFQNDGALIADLVRGFNGLTYCDGAPPEPCTSAIVTVTTSYPDPNAAGVTAFVDYPEDLLDIPGGGSEPSVVARIENLSGVVGGTFLVGDQDTNANTLDDRVSAGLLSLGAPIPAGPFAEATFDCKPGEPSPEPADFVCTLDASDLGGNTIAGACSVTVTLVP
jgi:hypothetical protein